jgi:hypothetical protein
MALVVRTPCHLLVIDRDYEAFNDERTAFYNELGIDPVPASTVNRDVQAATEYCENRRRRRIAGYRRLFDPHSLASLMEPPYRVW